MDRRIRYFFYATVFVTGAAVLIVEVAAVRMLAPFFGTSLFVLSSVLTTILLALSFGYYAGGKLSDRLPDHIPLYTIITSSGLALLLLLSLALRLLPASSAVFSVFSGPLILSLALFFTPAFLLGIVSPYIIKLVSRTIDEDRVGSVVGATFFWGTLGSIVGSLATGFYLVPVFGVTMSLLSTGVVLLLLGVLGEHLLNIFFGRETSPLQSMLKRIFFLAAVAAIALVAIRFIMVVPTAALSMNVLYNAEGLYSHIHIYEANHLGRPIRALKRDMNSSSATFMDGYDLVYGYTKFAQLADRLKPDMERFLLIGGGAYSIPRTLVADNEELAVEVVEIEPDLFVLAQKYFDVSDTSRIRNHVMDGRVFLQQTKQQYDVIFGDAFGTDLGVPHHLTTIEFLEVIKAHLTQDGVYMLNFIGTLYSEPVSLSGSMLKTITSVFPNTKAYAFNKSNPNTRQNIMVVARNGDAPIDFAGERINATNGIVLSVPSLEISIEDFNLADEIILTDDRAPLEYLMLKQY